MNYSKNILYYEQRVNMLICNLLKHILNTYQKYKEEKVNISELTETEKTIFTKLDILSKNELDSFKLFVDIINLGLLKYLNKYFTIDVFFDHSVNINFRTLRDPDIFRKITKKLKKEDKNNSIINTYKKVFNSNYVLISSILKDMIEIDNPHLSSNSVDIIEELLEKNIISIEANVLNKFIINSLQPKENINE